MFERKPHILYHYDGMGGAHDLAHEGAGHAHASMQEFAKVPPTTLTLEMIGRSAILYHALLHVVLATSGGYPHPHEETELARVHRAFSRAHNLWRNIRRN